MLEHQGGPNVPLRRIVSASCMWCDTRGGFESSLPHVQQRVESRIETNDANRTANRLVEEQVL